MRGGDEVESRIRVAASAGIVAAGLFVTGLGGAMALAESDEVGAPSVGAGAGDPGAVPQPDVDRTKTPEGQEVPGTRETDPPKTEHTGTPSTPKGGDPGSPTESSEHSSTPTTDQTTTATSSPTSPTTSSPTTTSPTTTTTAPVPGDTGSDHDGPEGVPPKLDEPGPVTPSVLDAVPGLPVVVPMAPIAVPVIIPPLGLPSVIGVGSGGGGAGGGGGVAPRVGPPEAPARGGPAQEPAARRPEAPVRSGEPAAVPASFRVGYGEYLRTAGVAQIAAVAVPGTAGIMALTGLGSLVGYRQAKSGRAARTESIARFMN